MHNGSYSIIQSEKSKARRGIKKIRTLAWLKINNFFYEYLILVSAFNAACFTVSRTLIALFDSPWYLYAVIDNAQLLLFDYLI